MMGRRPRRAPLDEDAARDVEAVREAALRLPWRHRRRGGAEASGGRPLRPDRMEPGSVSVVGRPRSAWFRYVFALFNGVALAVIVFAASGGARPFLAPPQRAWGVALLVIYQTGSIALCGGLGRGERRVRESPVFHLSFQIVGLFILLGLPVLDVLELAVFSAPGALRTAGLVVALIGLVLRLGSMAQLGARFTHFIVRLEEHQLVTRGFYSHLRHPSYLGMLLVSLGLALVFRSTLGLLLVPVLFGLLAWRIRTEEAFLTDQFGDEYRAYQARTVRLVPGVY